MEPNILTIITIVIFGVFIFYYVPFGAWVSAKASGVNISLSRLFLMKLRKVSPSVIVMAMIEAQKAELRYIEIDQLEAHYLAGGDVKNVIHALIIAEKGNINLTFKKAVAANLAGVDVVKIVSDFLKAKKENINTTFEEVFNIELTKQIELNKKLLNLNSKNNF
jgi:uncharacterized protein YqfA (UPF0365 family)